MPLVVRYHVEDRLPADAVAILEPQADGRVVDITLSRAHSLEVIAQHLSALATAYCQGYDVRQQLTAV